MDDDVQTPESDEQPEAEGGKRAQRQARQEAVARAEAAEARLSAFQRREVARLAAATLAEGADVLEPALGGVELEALLDQDGVPDPELVAAAAEAMAGKRPGLARQRRTSSGSPDGGAREAPPRPRGWTSVLQGQR